MGRYSHCSASVRHQLRPRPARTKGTGKIISFHYTEGQIRGGTKTVTRRDWGDSYARRFKPGDLCQAWTHSPHRGGKFIRQIRIKETRLEGLEALSNTIYGATEMAKEGLPWLDPKEFVETFFARSRRNDGTVWRIEFEYV